MCKRKQQILKRLTKRNEELKLNQEFCERDGVKRETDYKNM
jgi:hypothetical protein